MRQVSVDCSVAFTRGLFEAQSIGDDDFPARVPNESCSLQGLRGKRDGAAVGRQYFREELVGERQGVQIGSIIDHQKPSAETLLDSM